MRKRANRRALYGWIILSPGVLVIVAVLAFDAYLNIETRRNDYEVAQLKQRAQSLNLALERVRNETASAQQLHKLQEQAVVLGLRPPEPWQIENVALPGGLRDASSFQIARALPEPQVAPERMITTVARPVPAVQEPAQDAPEALELALGVETAPGAPLEIAQDPELALMMPLLESIPASGLLAPAEPPQAHVARLTPIAPVQLDLPAALGPERAEPRQPEPPVEAEVQPVSLDDSVEFLLAL